MPHDFKKFPELTNNQMQFYYFESPHKQITESFIAEVVKVTDGDTIRVKTDFRDFDFPVRLKNIQAPELSEAGGLESLTWLASQVLGQEVMIQIDRTNRVGKFGRLIGDVLHGGMSMSEAALRESFATKFGEQRTL